MYVFCLFLGAIVSAVQQDTERTQTVKFQVLVLKERGNRRRKLNLHNFIENILLNIGSFSEFVNVNI